MTLLFGFARENILYFAKLSIAILIDILEASITLDFSTDKNIVIRCKLTNNDGSQKLITSTSDTGKLYTLLEQRNYFTRQNVYSQSIHSIWNERASTKKSLKRAINNNEYIKAADKMENNPSAREKIFILYIPWRASKKERERQMKLYATINLRYIQSKKKKNTVANETFTRKMCLRRGFMPRVYRYRYICLFLLLFIFNYPRERTALLSAALFSVCTACAIV